MKNRAKLYINKLKTTGFFHVFGSGVLVKLLNFLNSFILIRIVDKLAYGRFSYVNNIYSIMIIFSGLGAASAVLQMGAENINNQSNRKAVYAFGLLFGECSNVLISLLVLVVCLLFDFRIEGSRLLLSMYIPLPILYYLLEFQTVWLRSERKNKEYSSVNVIYSVALVVASVLGALIWKEKGFIIGQYFAVIVALIVGKRIGNIDVRFSLGFKNKKDFIKISILSVLCNSLSQLKTLASSFFMSIFIPNEVSLAEYNVAIKLPLALLFIPSAFVVYIYPYFAEHIADGEWCKKKYLQITAGMVAFNGIISLLLIIFSNPIVFIVFGKEYIDAVPIFNVMVLNYFVSASFYSITGNLLVAQRKVGYNLIVNILTGTLSIVLNILFIPKLGSMGAALSVLLTSIFGSIVYVCGLLYFYGKRKNEFNKSKQNIGS